MFLALRRDPQDGRPGKNDQGIFRATATGTTRCNLRHSALGSFGGAETIWRAPVTNIVTSMQSEDLLIQRARDGDEGAMRALWSRHAPHIDAVVRRLVGYDLDLAADVAQEVWIQIFRALPQYRGDSQFGTWAHRIAVNRTLNALRKTRRLANIETPMEEDTVMVEQDQEGSSLMATIERAADQLSPGARAVFVLHDVEGYTHEEIAERLGITSGGSKSQLFKARAKLRNLLAHLLENPVRKDVDHVAPVY